MKERTVIGISLAVVVLGTAFFWSRQIPVATLTPAELIAKRVSPPLPPNDSCEVATRTLAHLSSMRPIRARTLLSPDEIAIYRAVIDRWNSGPSKRLNVADRTFPLDRALTDCECLKNIDLHDLASAARSFHTLPSDVLPTETARLVDRDSQSKSVIANDPNNSIREVSSIDAAVDRAFENGLFQLSEIAFDSQHRRALVGYSFVCGSLCGSGGVWMFEKLSGIWNKSEHSCGGWIS